MPASSRSRVAPFAVMEIIAAANAARAAGRPVLSLCAGEPSGGACPAVRERAAAALHDAPLGYTEALGSPELRSAIAGHYRRWYGVDLDPARVAVTTGSSGGFLLAFLAGFEAGDRVALPRPGYPAYRNALTALGCEVVDLPCGPDTGYRPTPAHLDALGVPPAGLVVAGPANPTGTVVDAAGMLALQEWCAGHGTRLVSDEIYHGITYPGSPAAAAAAGPAGAPTALTGPGDPVVANSFSKYWAMTGWRLGWLVLPDDLVPAVDALAGNLALCPPAPAQHAAPAAFSDEGYAAARAAVAGYARSRAAVLAALPDLGWRDVAPADGAFYLYADVSATGLDAVTYCTRLLAEADVALTPGTDFDPVDGGTRVRLSFAADPADVTEALSRIVGWQRGL